MVLQSGLLHGGPICSEKTAAGLKLHASCLLHPAHVVPSPPQTSQSSSFIVPPQVPKQSGSQKIQSSHS